MITLEQLLASCRHEVKVIKHLAAKVPEGQMDWRPTPDQRSTRELLQYLPMVAESGAVYSVTGNWDHAPAMSEKTAGITPENFAEAMDGAMARVTDVLAGVDEHAATTKPANMPWMEPTTQSACMLQSVLSGLIAYRMQLFLYAKQSGNTDLNSMDCWAGFSQPPT